MKQIALVVATLILPLSAETLSRGDRDFAMSHLHASSKLFLDAIAGLSEAQWKFKPAPDRWSIGEVAEHLALSEDFLFTHLTGNVLKSEPAAESKPASREQDEQVIAMIRDRSKKGTAPEPLKPSNKWSTREALAGDFKKSRERNIAYVETTGDDLRGHTGMKMDGYQWILLISAHAERHTAQINEVKADPGYPKQ
jgi:uncharacterized damage-inducible protein DinB